jgi:hypothetical protein
MDATFRLLLRLFKYDSECTTSKSSLVASNGSTTRFFSRCPSLVRNLHMRPHLEESNGCLHSHSHVHRERAVRDFVCKE